MLLLLEKMGLRGNEIPTRVREPVIGKIWFAFVSLIHLVSSYLGWFLAFLVIQLADSGPSQP